MQDSIDFPSWPGQTPDDLERLEALFEPPYWECQYCGKWAGVPVFDCDGCSARKFTQIVLDEVEIEEEAWPPTPVIVPDPARYGNHIWVGFDTDDTPHKMFYGSTDI